MRPASLLTVLEPQQAVARRSKWRLCVPPLPTMPRPVPGSTSMCTGGSLASVVHWVCLSQTRSLWPKGSLAVSHSLLDLQNQPLMGQFFVPTERLCPGGQLYSDCISSCPPSCSAVAQGEEGSCGKECVSGCECPTGLFWDGALCVPAAHCPCYYRRRRYAPGDTVKQQCNPWWVFGPSPDTFLCAVSEICPS